MLNCCKLTSLSCTSSWILSCISVVHYYESWQVYISIAALQAWKMLPTQLKLLRSTTSFCRQLKTFSSSQPMDIGMQTDDCFVMHPRSPSRLHDTNTPVTVTVKWGLQRSSMDSYCMSCFCCCFWRQMPRRQFQSTCAVQLLNVWLSSCNCGCILPLCFKDDYRISLRYEIITKDMEPLCPVDMSGRFTDPVSDFKGQYVKVSLSRWSLLSFATCGYDWTWNFLVSSFWFCS